MCPKFNGVHSFEPTWADSISMMGIFTQEMVGCT